MSSIHDGKPTVTHLKGACRFMLAEYVVLDDSCLLRNSKSTASTQSRTLYSTEGSPQRLIFSGKKYVHLVGEG